MIINNRGDGGAHQRVTGLTRQKEEKKEEKEFLRADGPNKGSTRGSIWVGGPPQFGKCPKDFFSEKASLS